MYHIEAAGYIPHSEMTNHIFGLIADVGIVFHSTDLMSLSAELLAL